MRNGPFIAALVGALMLVTAGALVYVYVYKQRLGEGDGVTFVIDLTTSMPLGVHPTNLTSKELGRLNVAVVRGIENASGTGHAFVFLNQSESTGTTAVLNQIAVEQGTSPQYFRYNERIFVFSGQVSG